MMGKKNLREVRAEVAALLETIPGRSPSQWFEREIEAAKGQPERDLETLRMLCAALKREVGRRPKGKSRGTATQR
jgi:hypothetical protein